MTEIVVFLFLALMIWFIASTDHRAKLRVMRRIAKTVMAENAALKAAEEKKAPV